MLGTERRELWSGRHGYVQVISSVELTRLIKVRANNYIRPFQILRSMPTLPSSTVYLAGIGPHQCGANVCPAVGCGVGFGRQVHTVAVLETVEDALCR